MEKTSFDIPQNFSVKSKITWDLTPNATNIMNPPKKYENKKYKISHIDWNEIRVKMVTTTTKNDFQFGFLKGENDTITYFNIQMSEKVMRITEMTEWGQFKCEYVPFILSLRKVERKVGSKNIYVVIVIHCGPQILIKYWEKPVNETKYLLLSNDRDVIREIQFIRTF